MGLWRVLLGAGLPLVLACGGTDTTREACRRPADCVEDGARCVNGFCFRRAEDAGPGDAEPGDAGPGDAGPGDARPGDAASPPASVTDLELSFVQNKLFRFSWTDVDDATHYRLLEDPDGGSGYIQVGDDIPPGTETADHEVPLHRRLNARYLVQSCNSSGCTDSAAIEAMDPFIGAIGYFKASNTGNDDRFGTSIALSGDGHTLAVGAPFEDSAASGVGGDESNDSEYHAGAVYVFRRNSAGMWSQEAYVKANNTGQGDQFGTSVSLSEDGNTLAVGAIWESSAATGVDGDGNDNSKGNAGAVYVFRRSATGGWSQEAYVKASNTDSSDNFGWSVALSGDGNTLAVGAIWEASAATGVDGDESNNSAGGAGAAYVFRRDPAGNWSQEAYVKASNPDMNDLFGWSVALSRDGSTLAVGAVWEASAATGVGGDGSNNSASNAGAVYVFLRSGGVWSQEAYIKASNAFGGSQFGHSVSLSTDGNTLVVGANREGSAATGVNGDETDHSAGGAGAVYVFRRSGAMWSQQAYIKASNTDADDEFGHAVSLSGDGNLLAVGAKFETSATTGVGGDESDNSLRSAGATYVFRRDTTGSWSQEAYVKASNTDLDDEFGFAVSLSGHGSVLAVGAKVEASAATGVGGNPSDNSSDGAGAVYLY